MHVHLQSSLRFIACTFTLHCRYRFHDVAVKKPLADEMRLLKKPGQVRILPFFETCPG